MHTCPSTTKQCAPQQLHTLGGIITRSCFSSVALVSLFSWGCVVCGLFLVLLYICNQKQQSLGSDDAACCCNARVARIYGRALIFSHFSRHKMGNRCTSCCGETAETQLEIEPPGVATSNKSQSPAALPAEEMVKKFKPEMLNKLYKGFAVGLILQDKSRLECTVTLAKDDQAIELACNSRSRRVPLTDIKNILYTPEQLKRVDYSAGISADDVCVALHLAESGNCIPLFFSAAADRDCFVISLLRIREKHAAGSAAPAN